MTQRTSLIVLLLLLAAGAVLAQPMSGTYTVKKDGSGDFTSVYAACQALSSRQTNGNVTINVYSGYYDEGYMYLYYVNQSRPQDTITIQAAPGQDVTVYSASSYAVYSYYTYNVKLKNLKLICASTYGLYMYYAVGWRVENCVIRATSYCVYASSGCNYDSFISCDLKGGSYTMYLYNSSYAYGHYLANNFIYGWTSYGIYAYYGYYWKLIYNTIIGNGSYGVYAYYQYGDTWKNNILQANTYGIYRYYGDAVPAYSNYNAFWRNGGTTSDQVIYSRTYGAQTLAQWQTSSGRDLNSIQQNPMTGGAINPHLKTGSPCINAGNPWPGITKDIDGDTRSSTTPCIGADEYTTVGSPMSGTYYIKPGVLSSDTFPSFEKANVELAVRGQSGNVTFEVFAGIYKENISLAGMDPTPYWISYVAHLTSGKPDLVNVVASGNYGIELRGNKRIRFRNINVAGASYAVYLYYRSTTVGGGCDTIVFDGCNLTGNTYAIYAYNYYGGSDDSIYGCKLVSGSSYGVYLYGNSATSYQNYRNYIANNFITGWTSYGIYTYYQYNPKYIYNTIIGNGSYAVYAYYQYGDTWKNNILQANTYGMYRYYGDAVPAYSNYNAFWLNSGSSGSAVIYSTSYGAQTLAQWQASTSRDLNSIQQNPLTGGVLNPHLKTGSPCINAGNPWPGITKDIDGDTRSSTTPCIGADEYTTVGSPMSGTYYIKPGVSATDTFPSFTDALGQLALRGQSGDVTFEVFAGTYPEILNLTGLQNGPYWVSYVARRVSGVPDRVDLAAFGTYGVRLIGNKRIRFRNINVSGASYGFYLDAVTSVYPYLTPDTLVIDGCEVRAASMPIYGYVYYGGSDDSIINNTLIGGSYGIYWYGSSSYYAYRPVFINNMISGWSSYGIYTYYTRDAKFLFNTIAGSGSYAGMFYYPYNLTIRNNIFRAASYAAYFYYGDVIPASSNYNSFSLTTGGEYVIYSQLYYNQTLSQWQASTGKDTNSQASDPQLVSLSDLHLQGSSPCIGAGQTTPGVTLDIDRDTRGDPPDIGADEFYIDVAASRIASPASAIPVGAPIQPSGVFRHLAGPGASFWARMELHRGASLVYVDTVQVNIARNDSVTAVFREWTPTIVASNYTATMFHKIGGDADPSNDTVRISFRVGNVDCGTSAIIAPPDPSPLGGVVYPTVVVTNYGDFDASCDVQVTISDPTDGDLNSGEVPTDEAAPRPLRKVGFDALVYDTTETFIVPVGATETLTFTKGWTPTVQGNHNATCRVNVLYDTDPTNDFMSKPFVVQQIDFGVTQVLAPTGSVTQGTSVAPSVKIKNFGSGTASCGARVIVLSGATPVYDQTETGISIPAGEEVTRTFATPWQANQLGPFTVTAYTIHDYDTDPTNDTGYASGTVVPAGGGTGTWTCVSQMPSGVKPIGDGGWLAYADGLQRLFVARGNKQPDFFSYDPAGLAWEPKANWPNGIEAKPPSKGAVATPYPGPDGKLYALKGNNTLGFWSYDVNQDSWKQLADIPLGTGKKVKGGSDLVYYDGKVYCLKGYTNDFLVYNPATDSWTPLPSVPAPNTKFDKGSWLCLDEATGKIYCHQAKYHAFYAYDIAGGTWGAALKGMPTINSLGKKKKSKDGGSGTFRNDVIFAFKGGNTLEFWKYAINGDSWSEQTEIPLIGLSGAKKKVKGGGDLVALNPQPNPIIYGIKGNKTNELWTYEPLGFVASVPRAERSGVMAVTTDSRRMSLAVSPNPLASGFATLSYSLPQPGAATVRVYDAAGRAVLVRSLAVGRSGQVGLDLRSLSAGVYLVKLSTESLTATHKLVVER